MPRADEANHAAGCRDGVLSARPGLARRMSIRLKQRRSGDIPVIDAQQTAQMTAAHDRRPIQQDAMKNVVKNDAEQGAGANAAAGDTSAPKKRRKKRAEVPKRRGKIISAPREKPDTPVSTRLTKEEHQALKLCAAVLGKRSKSHAIRIAIQHFVARNDQVKVSLSLGVVDDIYPATIHQDVVDLSNQLRAMEFLMLRIADQLPPSSSKDQLKLMLDDASKTLERIAGRVQRKS